jgi:hypothetical protein
VHALREKFAGYRSVLAIRDQNDREIRVTQQVREMTAGVRESVTAGDALGAFGVNIYNDAAHDFGDGVDRGDVVTL